MAVLPLPLQEVLDILQRAYKDGFPEEDYFPLLAVLQSDMSEENLASVVAEFLDDETTVIVNDAAKAASSHIPSRADLHRVRHRLERLGWRSELDDDDG